MLNRLILESYEKLETLECCHTDKDTCCCYDCLSQDFRERPDEYTCEKKMTYYVSKYASSYTSEFYNYLDGSKILEEFNNKRISILSLGCGFSPDYYAIQKYITNKQLNIQFDYKGIDKSVFWNNTRNVFPNTSYEIMDLCTPFSITGYDIIIMSKVFSTLYKHGEHITFISNLQNAITTTNNITLVFNDINSYYMGRDCFDKNIKGYFSKIRRFYTDHPPHKDSNWVKLNDLMIFPVIPNPTIDPLNEIRQYVFFEYRN